MTITTKLMREPAVIMLINQFSTTNVPLDTERKDRHANAAVIRMQNSGTPRLVHFLINAGALPSRDSPYKARVAAKKYVLPAENILVQINAFTRCGNPWMLRFVIAMTYGEADAVLTPLLTIVDNVGSLYGTRMPTHKDPRMKKTPNLQ